MFAGGQENHGWHLPNQSFAQQMMESSGWQSALRFFFPISGNIYLGQLQGKESREEQGKHGWEYFLLNT